VAFTREDGTLAKFVIRFTLYTSLAYSTLTFQMHGKGTFEHITGIYEVNSFDLQMKRVSDWSFAGRLGL